MVVELRLNGRPFEPNFFTSLKKNFEIKEKIIIPIKYCDLSLVSLIGITIYDMKRPFVESVVASTTIDLFDNKHRLRQGTYNLYLWPGLEADIT
jgi:Phosphoinositide 3-kinase C2